MASLPQTAHDTAQSCSSCSTYLRTLLAFFAVHAFAYAQSEYNGRITTSESVQSSGGHVFVVTNASDASLTGITVNVTRTLIHGGNGAESWWFFDSIINPGKKPILPGASYTFDVGSVASTKSLMIVRVEAAIFSDGKAVGERDAIRSLWLRRVYFIEALKQALYEFEQSPNIDDRDTTIRFLLEWQNRVATKSREERDSRQLAFGTVLDNIRGNPHVPLGDVLVSMKKRLADRETTLGAQPTPEQAVH